MELISLVRDERWAKLETSPPVPLCLFVLFYFCPTSPCGGKQPFEMAVGKLAAKLSMIDHLID
jgi:hypothetical protein